MPVAISATNCWNKIAHFFRKLAKEYPHQCLVKNLYYSTEPQKLPNIWATFEEKESLRSSKNSQIWSHWLQRWWDVQFRSSVIGRSTLFLRPGWTPAPATFNPSPAAKNLANFQKNRRGFCSTSRERKKERQFERVRERDGTDKLGRKD